ncbi:tRNA uridine-5-carboxymethylaminomethyl(34) synthesis GTPase MnmE [Geomonas azotofigens]|uniref:tRNA uridine-5-carboxymethylaminomethyl(34) synthesis GTPase MnmE n=1 Tax=Geomonas azotofigens TaxID=2843196 RepID=UPI001C10D574|nr:tRNA uridine-5-carboxymethylaminomethyl(34) synthesis GTPase MnmE [Geomonas azotofigens]MBU5611822.1 tRNA uridine-5-carboxymethylaminomethyl(34) synthesis GTPase MnmE [Geomonas azotofigens]
MYVRDTIAAISTAVGEGGIGIVRISGPASLPIASSIFRAKSNGGLKSHRFSYGDVVNPANGDLVDEAMVVYMKGPNSYTREDVVEIQCHGGTLVVSRILGLALEQGARLAEPGEFTKRAFLNGRIDLVQAEAVMDVISSRTDASLALAQHQREGLLSKRISTVKEGIVYALAYVEALIDFPEDDVDVAVETDVLGKVAPALAELDALIQGFDEGKVLRDGVSVVIAGKPNVGKSSLLNTLLKEKRAIVTSVPGTTRDLIEEVVNINGLPVKLLDTAGIRESEDQVEQEGVRLSLDRIPKADLVLFVVDGSTDFCEDDVSILQAIGSKSFIVVRNKADLSVKATLPDDCCAPVVALSTLTGQGVPELRDAISNAFMHGHAIDGREFVAVSKARHRDALLKAQSSLLSFVTNVEAGVNMELLPVDLRDALDAVGQVTGETTADDVLDRIFSSFCIGK